MLSFHTKLLATAAGALLGSNAYGEAPRDAAAAGRQEQAQPAANPGVANGDIVVTAQRRAQSLQDVPIAMTAATGPSLAQSSITNVVGIVMRSPSVSVSSSVQGGSNAGLFIRGIGQFDFNATNDPGVGMYLDGVYIARTAGAALDLLDIDRVEVLRGPQGTLYGKNTIGGAINVITARPDAGEISGMATVRAGERNRLDVGGVVNLPLIADQLALRISSVHKSQDGYGHSLYNGAEMSNQDRTISKAELRWTPSSAFSAELAGDWTHVREEAKLNKISVVNTQSFVTIPQNQFALANGLEPFDSRWIAPGKYENYAGFQPGDKEDIWGARLTITYDLGFASLKSITAYRRMKVDTGLDFDSSPFAIGDQTVAERDRQLSQELLLSGNLLKRLDYVLGAYYLNEKGDETIYLPLSYVQNPVGFDTLTTNKFTNETAAVFGQASYKLSDALSLTAGGRYSYERKKDTIRVIGTKFGFDLLPTTNQEKSFNSFTWHLAAQYRFNRDVMAYASASSGYKSGGFNGRAQSTFGLRPYNPEKATTYEVGAKSELFSHLFRLNADVFWTDYKDIQTTLSLPDPITGVATTIVANPAGATIKGIEIEGNISPARWILLDYGASYVDGRFKNLAPGADVTLDSKLPSLSKWYLNAGLTLKLDLPSPIASDGILSTRIDYSYRSSFYFSAQNSIYNRQDGYGIVDARLSYGPKDWDVALYARNLLNKYYFVAKDDLTAFVYAVNLPAPPREIGFEFTKRF